MFISVIDNRYEKKTVHFPKIDLLKFTVSCVSQPVERFDAKVISSFGMSSLSLIVEYFSLHPIYLLFFVR